MKVTLGITAAVITFILALPWLGWALSAYFDFVIRMTR